ncbi:MAG: formylglycine-generating enzyme family protein [Bacteroidales bacterium]
MIRKYLILSLSGVILWTSCKKSDPSVLEIAISDTAKIEMVLIPSGNFLMGSDTTEQDRHSDEGPLRNVTISKPFYMGKYEITQQQWLEVMDDNPSIFKDKENWKEYPVDWVSWNDCVEFTEKLSKITGKTFRLPTEAEWEYACRAGTTTRYYWGEDPADKEIVDYAWAFSYSEGRSHPVGLKKPNAWGLYDMSGNVWEWCLDWREPYNPADTLDPNGSLTGTRKIYRGGSWFNERPALRSANRNGHPPETLGTNAGLRVIMEN